MNKTTIERLSSFARLWGQVYLFHPALSTGDADLLPPTLAAIDAILTARDKASYTGAIESFLGSLKDPQTKIRGKQQERPESQKIDVPAEWHLTRDNIAVMRVTAFEALGEKMEEAIIEAVRSLRTPAGIVLDARGTDWWTGGMIRNVVRNLIPRAITQGGTSWRRHSGFATEGLVTSGGYYSSIEQSQPKLITPSRTMRKRALRCPIVIVATANEPDPITLGNALWFAGLGGLVIEGPADMGLEKDITMAGNVKIQLRIGDWINPDGSVGFAPTIKVRPSKTKVRYLSAPAVKAAARLALNPTEPPALKSKGSRSILTSASQSEDALPDRASRIFAWIKLWNVIHYFFPYHELTDRPWDDSLEVFLPRFASANTPAQYAMTAAEACAWMDDSHAGVSGPGWIEVIGSHFPLLTIRRIEDRFVVTELHAEVESAGVRIGDIIESVGGVPAEQIAQRMRSYIAHSTEQAFYQFVARFFLAGKEVSVEVKVRRGTDDLHPVTLQRHSEYWLPSSSDPVFKVLPDGYGYVDLVRLEWSDIEDMLKAVKDTTALIIDIRGYPRGAMFGLAPHLTSKKVIGALFSRPEAKASTEGTSGIAAESSVEFRMAQTIHPSSGVKYEKPIVVLIDERAISHAEHSCLFVEATSAATFIGTPTMGVDGDVTAVSLPGRMWARFTGHNVRHGDGRQLQRVGILPDIKVAPTIAGIRKGRDEVLEAAIAHLKKTIT